MLFNSISYLLFFPVVTLLYFLFPHKLRWLLLLAASCLFYITFIPKYILILFFLILVDYVAAIQIQKSKGKTRARYLLVSIFSTLVVLLVFKYFNFFSSNISTALALFGLRYQSPLFKFLLPVGLSFHTFQSLSYVIEVYKKKQKAERHLGVYALYVMFYPQLVAGPIERPQHLLPQLHKAHAFSYTDATTGLKRIVFGLFKKIVIADRLSLVVTQVYSNPHNYTGLPLVIATIAFAFQIYCDFSGYSDIAIGSARVMGITLSENFNYPYAATSIQDFWRRWHISLYSWFRDYVYIPLGGNRKNKFILYRNILLTFVLSGLWHGAAWTYVAWGLFHGIYVSLYTTQKRHIDTAIKIIRKKIPRDIVHTASIAMTFFFVCIAWIFFRANSLDDAIYIITHASVGTGNVLHAILINDTYALHTALFGQGAGLGLNPDELWIAVGSVVCMGIYEWLHATRKIRRIPPRLHWAIYILLALALINLGITKKIPFIYFQF